jgi:hypothetical protein
MSAFPWRSKRFRVVCVILLAVGSLVVFFWHAGGKRPQTDRPESFHVSSAQALVSPKHKVIGSVGSASKNPVLVNSRVVEKVPATPTKLRALLHTIDKGLMLAYDQNNDADIISFSEELEVILEADSVACQKITAKLNRVFAEKQATEKKRAVLVESDGNVHVELAPNPYQSQMIQGQVLQTLETLSLSQKDIWVLDAVLRESNLFRVQTTPVKTWVEVTAEGEQVHKCSIDGVTYTKWSPATPYSHLLPDRKKWLEKSAK